MSEHIDRHERGIARVIESKLFDQGKLRNSQSVARLNDRRDGIGQRDFCLEDIEARHGAGLETALLVLQLRLQDGNRLLAHADQRTIEDDVVEKLFGVGYHLVDGLAQRIKRTVIGQARRGKVRLVFPSGPDVLVDLDGHIPCLVVVDQTEVEAGIGQSVGLHSVARIDLQGRQKRGPHLHHLPAGQADLLDRREDLGIFLQSRADRIVDPEALGIGGQPQFEGTGRRQLDRGDRIGRLLHRRCGDFRLGRKSHLHGIGDPLLHGTIKAERQGRGIGQRRDGCGGGTRHGRRHTGGHGSERRRLFDRRGCGGNLSRRRPRRGELLRGGKTLLHDCAHVGRSGGGRGRLGGKLLTPACREEKNQNPDGQREPHKASGIKPRPPARRKAFQGASGASGGGSRLSSKAAWSPKAGSPSRISMAT